MLNWLLQKRTHNTNTYLNELQRLRFISHANWIHFIGTKQMSQQTWRLYEKFWLESLDDLRRFVQSDRTWHIYLFMAKEKHTFFSVETDEFCEDWTIFIENTLFFTIVVEKNTSVSKRMCDYRKILWIFQETVWIFLTKLSETVPRKTMCACCYVCSTKKKFQTRCHANRKYLTITKLDPLTASIWYYREG